MGATSALGRYAESGITVEVLDSLYFEEYIQIEVSQM